MFSEVAVSAPSKIILHGEHSVVYGKTALAASLDLRTRIVLRPNPNPELLTVDFPDIGVKQSWDVSEIRSQVFSQKPDEEELNGIGAAATSSSSSSSSSSKIEVNPYFLEVIHDFLRVDEDNLKMASLICFFYLYSVISNDVLAMNITVESEIPIGAGLGSSAALSVCLAAGLLAIKQEQCKIKKETGIDHAEICRLAYLSEKILHGTPSGVDNSVSTYGGIIKFNNGQVTALKEVPRLRILLVNTNVTRNTKTLVDRVRSQFIAMPRVIKAVLDAMDGVSQTSLGILEDMAKNGDTKEKYQCLESLIDYNQKLLETLNVSHPALENIIKLSKQNGDLHAKLTGAGGGGFALVLIPPMTTEKTVSSLKDILSEKGYTCWESELGVSGVQVQRQNRSDEHQR